VFLKNPGKADTCGYCGEGFAGWEEFLHHLYNTHKFCECKSSKTALCANRVACACTGTLPMYSGFAKRERAPPTES